MKKKLTKKEVLLKIEKGGNFFKNLSSEFKDDKEIVLSAINVWPGNFQYASKRLRKDKNIVKTAFKLSGPTFLDADESLKKDHKFLKELEKISENIWNYSTTPEHENEKNIQIQKQQKKALSNEKRNKKWHLDYKPQLKRSYSYLYKFSLENYITQIDMYSGIASFSINDQFNKKFVSTFIGDDHFKFRKKIKTSDGFRFHTGRDMYYYSHLYLDKKGKVKKIFIETTPDQRDSIYEKFELIYNDQFVYSLSQNDKSIIKSLNIFNAFRIKIGEVEISSGFIQVGESNKFKKKEIKNKVITEQTIELGDSIESYLLPVKNKRYPIYAYVYYFDDNAETNDNILIVVEEIEGCYIKEINEKKIIVSKIINKY